MQQQNNISSPEKVYIGPVVKTKPVPEPEPKPDHISDIHIDYASEEFLEQCFIAINKMLSGER